MSIIAARLNRIKPSPSSMASQRARELRAAGRDIIGLTSGEPDFDTPPNVGEAVVRAIAASKTKYTDVGGTPELKVAIIEKFRRGKRLDLTRAHHAGEYIEQPGNRVGLAAIEFPGRISFHRLNVIGSEIGPGGTQKPCSVSPLMQV